MVMMMMIIMRMIATKRMLESRGFFGEGRERGIKGHAQKERGERRRNFEKRTHQRLVDVEHVELLEDGRRLLWLLMLMLVLFFLSSASDVVFFFEGRSARRRPREKREERKGKEVEVEVVLVAHGRRTDFDSWTSSCINHQR